jgi:hypothetical protein
MEGRCSLPSLLRSWASGQPRYILAPSANGTSKEGKAAKSVLAAKKRQGEQPSLRDLLTNLLKKPSKPQLGSELAEQVLAAGYQSNSKNFINTVLARLTTMENVGHLLGKGYRLRR